MVVFVCVCACLSVLSDESEKRLPMIPTISAASARSMREKTQRRKRLRHAGGFLHHKTSFSLPAFPSCVWPTGRPSVSQHPKARAHIECMATFLDRSQNTKKKKRPAANNVADLKIPTFRRGSRARRRLDARDTLFPGGCRCIF